MEWLKSLNAEPLILGIAAIESSFGSQSSDELRDVLKKLAQTTIIWPNEGDFDMASQEFSRYKLSDSLGILDAVTAAIALRNNFAVATFNIKHFRAVLKLELIVPYERK